MKVSLMFTIVCQLCMYKYSRVERCLSDVVSLEEIVFHLARWWDGPCTQSH